MSQKTVCSLTGSPTLQHSPGQDHTWLCASASPCRQEHSTAWSECWEAELVHLTPLHRPFIPTCTGATSIPCAFWGVNIVSPVLHSLPVQEPTVEPCCCSSFTALLSFLPKDSASRQLKAERGESTQRVLNLQLKISFSKASSSAQSRSCFALAYEVPACAYMVIFTARFSLHKAAIAVIPN